MITERVTHTVDVPHPNRDTPVTAACTCGWTRTYGWGEWGKAKNAAVQHIEDLGSQAISDPMLGVWSAQYAEGDSL